MTVAAQQFLFFATAVISHWHLVGADDAGFCDANEDDPGCSADATGGLRRIHDVVFDEALNEYEQDDPRLVEYIRDKIMVAPSEPDVPYNFPPPTFKNFGFIAAQYGQPVIVDE